MKRKLFAVSMAAAMATSCFAGTAFASDSEPVTIKVTRACCNLANPDSEQVKKVQDAINEYIKDKINVQIELTDIGSGEYTEKANLALANNEINLLWTASWEATIGTNDLVPANAVYDITDLLPGTPLYESMDEGQWEATKYDGKNYFVPVYRQGHSRRTNFSQQSIFAVITNISDIIVLHSYTPFYPCVHTLLYMVFTVFFKMFQKNSSH